MHNTHLAQHGLSRRGLMRITLGASLSSLSGGALLAQQAAWPAKPVRVVVPYAPGNISDSSVRTIARHLGDRLEKQFFVDNKPGANTQIGTDYVARAEPDGHTILYTGPIITVMGGLFPQLSFNPMKDLVPVAQAITNPTVFLVRPDFPANDMREFIALTQQKPRQFFVASGGVGTMPHMAHELLCSVADMQSEHVPYRGGASWLADFMGGQIHGIFDNPSSAIPLIKDGRAKALAVTSLARSPALPQVKTVAEQGVPGFEVMNWFGFFAPARTPVTTVDKLNAHVGQVMQMPQVAEGFAKMGVTAVSAPQARFAEMVQADHAKWSRTIQERNLKPE